MELTLPVAVSVSPAQLVTRLPSRPLANNFRKLGVGRPLAIYRSWGVRRFRFARDPQLSIVLPVTRLPIRLVEP